MQGRGVPTRQIAESHPTSRASQDFKAASQQKCKIRLGLRKRDNAIIGLTPFFCAGWSKSHGALGLRRPIDLLCGNRRRTDTAPLVRKIVRTALPEIPPSFAVALNWGIGSSALKSEVNAHWRDSRWFAV